MLGVRQSVFSEICGWYGMLALIVAYFLVSFGFIDGEGVVFQLLNLTGGVGLIIVAASKGVIQSVLLNVFWAAIGLIAIAKILV